MISFFQEVFSDTWNVAAISIISVIFILSCIGEITSSYFFPSGVAKNGAALLTTTGILFTFIGVTLGLYKFDINNIDDSITFLLEGMKLAFVSSVAGILGALIFKIIQIVIRRIKTRQEASTDVASDIYNKLQEMNEGIKNGIKELNEALGGEKDTSIISHLSKLRTTTTDKFDELTKEFKTFAENMAENNSKTLIAALEEVMRDFNTKINEQLGESFKQLNEAVGKLLEWQENYRIQLEDLRQAYESSKESLEKSNVAIENISEHTGKIPVHLASMQVVIDEARIQVEDLKQKLDAFAEMKDKAVNAMPDIEKNLREFTEKLKTNISESVSSMKESLQDQQKTATAIHGMYEKFPEVTKEAITEAVGQFTRSMHTEIENSIVEMGKQITAITKEFSRQYSDVINSIGESARQVSSITETLRAQTARMRTDSGDLL